MNDFFGMDCYTKRKPVFPSGQEVEGGKKAPVLSLRARTSKESLVLTGYRVNSFCFVVVCIPLNKQSPLLQVNHCGIFCNLEGPLFENVPLVNGLFYFPPKQWDFVFSFLAALQIYFLLGELDVL